MTVLLSQPDAVVSVNAVQGRLILIAWDALGNNGGTGCVMGLVKTLLAEVGEVNCSPCLPFFFSLSTMCRARQQVLSLGSPSSHPPLSGL